MARLLLVLETPGPTNGIRAVGEGMSFLPGTALARLGGDARAVLQAVRRIDHEPLFSAEPGDDLD
jgi:hypothetical protein